MPRLRKRDGITVVEDHIYFDEAQSGSLRTRPGLEALKKAAEAKQFDVLLVDDSSRLSRDNQYFNTLLCLFQFWGIRLISVSDGLDMREEHASQRRRGRRPRRLARAREAAGRPSHAGRLPVPRHHQRALPHRPEEEDAPRADGAGAPGRLRADGFKLQVIPEEARVVQRIYRAFIDGTSLKDPMTGRIKKVERPKEEWVTQERAEMRIITDAERAAADQRWREIDGVFPSKKGKKGFQGTRLSYVDSHPTHLLSGGLRCGSCSGAIALVSGKGSGYYGCLNAARKTCTNKVLIARKPSTHDLTGPQLAVAAQAPGARRSGDPILR